MSTALSQVASTSERRRSQRLPLALPLTVRGTTLDSRSFQEDTFTLSISAHGALLLLANTVTLGQTLYLRNPQTLEQAGCWVTRFASPHGTFTRVGVEFVQPNPAFWSADLASMKLDEEALEDKGEIHLLPDPHSITTTDAQLPEVTEETAPLPATPPSPDALLQALEITLRQAAEQAVAAAATERLSPAVNRAAEAIGRYSHERIRQFDERVERFRSELVGMALEESLRRLEEPLAEAEQRLKTSLESWLTAASQVVREEFTERLRDMGGEATAKFANDAAGVTERQLALLRENAPAMTADARAGLEQAAEAILESHRLATAGMERAITEQRRHIELMATLSKEAFIDWEAKLRAFQGDLKQSSQQEVDQFRVRLRNVLTGLLNSIPH